LAKLIQICRENSMEPVFITQPAVVGDVIDPFTGVNLARVSSWSWNGKTMWGILELYNDVVRETAAQHQVYLIDLAKEMPKSTEYFYDTYHFTNAGCRKVAEILDQHLSPFLEQRFSRYVAGKY
jgi:hypothetical protein